MNSEIDKVWLITGCSTGFGRELVKLLGEAGNPVIATVRKSEQIKEIEQLGKRVKGVVLDVVNQDQIDAANVVIKKEFGRVDVLVNNAGYGSLGPVEEIGEEEMHRQFDVNVYGAVRMIKLALPYMREQKSGHILNITSIAGVKGFPGVGIYNGSKFALEGIGESLAKDVEHMNIKVTNVEPGPFRTNWGGQSATFSPQAIGDYKESGHDRMDNIKNIDGKQDGDPVKAAKTMIKLVSLENPPMHLPLGDMAYQVREDNLAELKAELAEFDHLGRPNDFAENE